MKKVNFSKVELQVSQLLAKLAELKRDSSNKELENEALSQYLALEAEVQAVGKLTLEH